MCPMIWLSFILGILFLFSKSALAFNVTFSTNGTTVHSVSLREATVKEIEFQLYDAGDLDVQKEYWIKSEDPSIADILGNKTFWANPRGSGVFNLTGEFIGRTKLSIARKEENGTTEEKSVALDIAVLLKDRYLTHVFTISVAVLVSLNYINMGCALDLQIVKKVILRPIGPIVGLFCQYVAMPLISYGAARLLFTDYVLQLGLFLFACCPGGGASNMWTVLLNGNLNLSITMTLISTVISLAMMPFWLYVLGRTLWDSTKTSVPVLNIFFILMSMVIPIIIGLLLQKYLPKVAKWSKKILAPFSIIMIIYIIIFGVYSNLYMFSIISWQIVYAASASVWIAFLVSLIVSVIARLPLEDAIAITVEAGIQNTGIAYVLLKTSLPEPDSSIASVVPVAASIVTPIPLTIVYLFIVIRRCFKKKEDPEKSHFVDQKLVKNRKNMGSMDEIHKKDSA